MRYDGVGGGIGSNVTGVRAGDGSGNASNGIGRGDGNGRGSGRYLCTAPNGDGFGYGKIGGFGDVLGNGTGTGIDTGNAVLLLSNFRPMSFYICQLHTLGGWR
jgi:hypothetical protein